MTEVIADKEEIDKIIDQFKQAAILYGMEKDVQSSLGYFCNPKPFERIMQEKENELKKMIYNNNNAEKT